MVGKYAYQSNQFLSYFLFIHRGICFAIIRAERSYEWKTTWRWGKFLWQYEPKKYSFIFEARAFLVEDLTLLS